MPNPFYMAAWIGLLVTSLNLMPVGQLDGGHGTFSLFGPRLHRKLGRVAFVAVALMAVLGFSGTAVRAVFFTQCCWR